MMRRIILLWAMLFFILKIANVSAGTTGKISGLVIDKATGKPMPGANVIVEGTILGAATDLNGFFTILQVPPGEYNVSASVIGYAKLNVNQVRIRIDQTTTINFALTMEAVEGEIITIVAEKDIIKEDVATSVVAISAEEVAELPFDNLDEVVGLQAGVEDGLVIRGGGADETLFQVDGITLRDPRNNQPITGIPLSAVKEVSIERGGFNAEYGQVRSGIINVVTKEGGKAGYSGTITFKYGPPAAKHFGVSPYDANSMWLRPYLDDEICWNGTESGVWDNYTKRQYPKFDGWNTISERMITDDDPTNDLTPAAAQRVFLWEHRRRPITNQPDYNVDLGFGGPVPFVSDMLGNLRFFTSYRREREMLLIPLSRDDYLDYDWTMQLTADLRPSMKIKATGLIGKSYNVAINATDNQFWGSSFGMSGTPYWSPVDYMRTPFEIARVTAEQRPGRIFSNSWYSLADVAYRSAAVKLTHTLNPTTFYEASLEYIQRSYTTGPGMARDTETISEILPGYFVDEAPMGWSPQPDAGITGMFFGGHTATSRDSSKLSAITLKLDLTSQIHPNHLIKSGFEFVYNDLDFDYGLINQFFGDVNYVKMHKYPLRFALYAQDKLETLGFILNVGLRLDYSNANTDWVVTNPFDKNYFSSKYNPTEDYDKKQTEADVALSPRLAISHPITENSKLFFNYGHFKQLPTYEEIFRIGRGAAMEMRNYGNPDLAMAKTISYELGYDCAFYGGFLLQFSAFYHDIVDQQAFTRYTSADGSISYNLANNDSYEDIRGFEFSLRKSFGTWWSGFVNYTYQVSTAGHFGKAQIYENPSEQRVYDLNTRNLYQERPIPRPFARANLTFRIPENYGPDFSGIKPLNNWSVNFLGFWKAGEYITWNPNSILSVAQNVRVKDYFNVILRLNKTFNFKRFKITLFAEWDNVLNTKILSGASFYDVNDYLDYMNSLHLPESNAYTNIRGSDQVGEYRKDGINFRPIEQVGLVNEVQTPLEDVLYYGNYMKMPDTVPGDNSTDVSGTLQGIHYWHHTQEGWERAADQELNQILEDKAYIDMPNQTSFNFLNPRKIFFGLRLSFDLN